MRYMVWNNKGGVGKTFLTYALASRYAELNPTKTVIVADLCPQSNVSEMLLGGNGTGEQNHERLSSQGKTIAGYIKERYNKSQKNRMGNESAYFVKVSDHNPHMPPNLRLLPGDVDLDVCSGLINYFASAPEAGAWRRSRLLLNDLLEPAEAVFGETVSFIDCNPSFANYTEIGALAANRLLVPCTADSASIRGFYNVIRLVFGKSVAALRENVSFPDVENDFFTFAKTATENRFVLPKIHLVIQNKSRSLDQSATAAFRAHIDKMQIIISTILESEPDLFTRIPENPVVNIKDGNTLAAIANHTGLPLSKFEHKRYSIYGKPTQANQTQIDALSQQINACVANL